MPVKQKRNMSAAGRVRIPGEDEKDSGLKANSDSGGKANGFRRSPEWLSRCPECFPQAERRWTSYRHNEPSKGGSECRPGDCPCNVPAPIMWPAAVDHGLFKH